MKTIEKRNAQRISHKLNTIVFSSFLQNYKLKKNKATADEQETASIYDYTSKVVSAIMNDPNVEVILKR